MVFMPMIANATCTGTVSTDVAFGGCLYYPNLLSHELGHYFGLAHTHINELPVGGDWSDYQDDGLDGTRPDPAKPRHRWQPPGKGIQSFRLEPPHSDRGIPPASKLYTVSAGTKTKLCDPSVHPPKIAPSRRRWLFKESGASWRRPG